MSASSTMSSYRTRSGPQLLSPAKSTGDISNPVYDEDKEQEQRQQDDALEPAESVENDV